MLGLFGKVRWALFDCVAGAGAEVERLPFEIGSDEAVDFRLDGAGVWARHCALAQVKGRGLCLLKRDEQAPLLLNGLPVELEALAPEQDYSLQVGSHFLLLRGGKDLEAWRAGLDAGAWFFCDPQTNHLEGPWPLLELCRAARQQGADPQTVVLPKGAQMGFFLRQLLPVFEDQLGLVEPEAATLAAAEPPVPMRSEGALTCPVCWLKFNVGDLMHVAVHDGLRGDPMLGQDAPLRFHATQFNDRGQALDAFGLPCTEMACPHCRRALHPGFLEVEHHIFSIVGDQSAGKSYYLSVLAKVLPVALFRQFEVVFQDADPAGNAMLNDMKKALFSARTPAEARLVKTQLEGAMYERLPRYGRTVALPKPFVFSLNLKANSACRCATIFYDNAGEHFQPGRDSADSPGAQHVASSAGILFLFDPFNHPEFHKRMSGQPDPQLEKPILDQQDVILAELKVRVKKLLNLDISAQVETPLAVLVGKCDAWMHLLGQWPFADPVRPGRLDLSALGKNSDRARQLMLELAPTVVANAEGFSKNVRYFPVSSFGHPPVKIGDGACVPDPRRLSPILVEVPVLWLLSNIRPDLVPSG